MEISKDQILELSKKYFRQTHALKEFTPGQTYIPVTAKVVDEADLAILIDSALDMWLTAGRFTRDFERLLPPWFGQQSPALMVNSGSSANLVAISSLGSKNIPSKKGPLRPGDEIITVAAGFPTTVNPIVQNGWCPVFVDVDLTTLNALSETIIGAVTERTRAIVLAHTLGNPYRADLLKMFCLENDIFLIEDCCDALGAEIAGSPVGSFGDYATISFYPAHHITTGEGGAVISASSRHRRVAESIRDWGRDCWCDPGKDNTCGKRFGWKLGDLPKGYDHKYTYSHIGYNLKATDMQAALGLSQLQKAAVFIEKRRANWSRLHSMLKASPASRRFVAVQPTENTNPSWFGFPVICESAELRDSTVRKLEELKIGTRLVFAGNITRQPAYKGVDYRIHGDLKNTDAVMTRAFWLPVHPGLSSSMIEYIIESLERISV